MHGLLRKKQTSMKNYSKDNFQRPSDIFNFLNKINDKEKKSELVNVINSGLKDLKEEIKKMSEEEKKIEDPELIVEIVEEILKFNEQNQQGKGTKILTSNQMLSRLPISLTQWEARNNSNKLKNEIKQLLYSLYRSKNVTKQVYNNLIKHIWIKNIIVHKIFIIIIIIIIITKGIHYKKWRQFLWILKIVKRMNPTDLN